jgi:hypothetical protein
MLFSVDTVRVPYHQCDTFSVVDVGSDDSYLITVTAFDFSFSDHKQFINSFQTF